MKSRAAEWGGGITLKSEWELSQINECIKAAAVDSFEETVHFLFINILSSHPFCLSCYSIFTHTHARTYLTSCPSHPRHKASLFAQKIPFIVQSHSFFWPNKTSHIPLESILELYYWWFFFTWRVLRAIWCFLFSHVLSFSDTESVYVYNRNPTAVEFLRASVVQVCLWFQETFLQWRVTDGSSGTSVASVRTPDRRWRKNSEQRLSPKWLVIGHGRTFWNSAKRGSEIQIIEVGNKPGLSSVIGKIQWEQCSETWYLSTGGAFTSVRKSSIGPNKVL